MIQFEEKYRNLNDGVVVSDDQVEGINFLLSRQGALLCFQTGFGKTITSLVTAKILIDSFDNSRVIIVAPVKTKKGFKKEMFQRIGFKKSDVGFISTGEVNYDIKKNRILFFTDTNIKKYKDIVDSVVNEGYKIVLMVDEAHKLADNKSAFSKIMKEVRNLATVAYGITATPLINDLDGLYNIVNFFCPGFLGKKTEFDNMYTIWHLENIYIKGGAKRKVKVLDGYKNLNDLNERLQKVLIVRSKDYDLKFSKQFKSMSESEYKVYEKVSSGMLFKDSEERNFSKRLHDLQRFIDRAYEGDEEITELSKGYGNSEFSTKEEILFDTVKLALSKKYSLIIYASYKDTIDRLHKVLKQKSSDLNLGKIYEITGSVDMKTREKVEDKISPNDIILITDAGTESINLQKCNCVILYDIPFSIKSIIQLIGRITRVDTKHSTQYVIFCGVTDTIDEYKYELFQMHLDAVQRAINVGKNIPLEDISIDTKAVKELREKLLWKYKGDPITKALRKEKRMLKKKIFTSSLEEANNIICPNKFLIEPLKLEEGTDIKEVSALYPDLERYNSFIEGKLPFTVLRSKYIDFLKSERGKALIDTLLNGLRSSQSDLLLVGNTKLPEVLKTCILDRIVS